MCHPVYKTIVEGYILYIIQITVAFWGLVCNAALLRDHLSTRQQASPFCSRTHELSHHRGTFPKSYKGPAMGPCHFPALPTAFNTSLQNLWSRQLVNAARKGAQSWDQWHQTPATQHHCFALITNHPFSAFIADIPLRFAPTDTPVPGTALYNSLAHGYLSIPCLSGLSR